MIELKKSRHWNSWNYRL